MRSKRGPLRRAHPSGGGPTAPLDRGGSDPTKYTANALTSYRTSRCNVVVAHKSGTDVPHAV